MSVECGICEHDLRGGHAPVCPLTITSYCGPAGVQELQIDAHFVQLDASDVGRLIRALEVWRNSQIKFVAVPIIQSCNLHADCDEADRLAGGAAAHCLVSDCDDHR